MALGAERAELTTFILGRSLGLTIAGVAIGLAGAAALARYLQGMLLGISAFDLSSFVIVPLVFVSVAAMASYLPARRAIRVDPLAALRCE
jgi:putative ABC transport system permease protein